MWFASLAALLLLPALASAEVNIAKKNRSENEYPGICVWKSLETCGKHLGIPATTELVNEHRGEQDGTTFDNADKELTRKKIKHEYRGWWTSSVAWLKEQTDTGYPVVIEFSKDSYLGAHAVTVVDVTDEHVYFVDSNDPQVGWFRYSRKDFRASWTGRAIVIWK